MGVYVRPPPREAANASKKTNKKISKEEQYLFIEVQYLFIEAQ